MNLNSPEQSPNERRKSALFIAAQSLDRELRNVKKLKRFSIGSMDMLVDPEFEYRVTNVCNNSSEDNYNTNASIKALKRHSRLSLSSISVSDEADLLLDIPSNQENNNERSFDGTASEWLGTENNDQQLREGKQYIKIDELPYQQEGTVINKPPGSRKLSGAHSYEATTSSTKTVFPSDATFNSQGLLWVPAGQHPNVMPKNYADLIQKTLDGIASEEPAIPTRRHPEVDTTVISKAIEKNKDSLSVNYNRKQHSIVRRPSKLRHSYTELTEGETENNENKEEVDNLQQETSNDDSISSLTFETSRNSISLKDITDELTKISNDAGFTSTDAISLARSLCIASSFSNNNEDKVTTYRPLDADRDDNIRFTDDEDYSDFASNIVMKHGLVIPARSSLRRSKFNTYRAKPLVSKAEKDLAVRQPSVKQVSPVKAEKDIHLIVSSDYLTKSPTISTSDENKVKTSPVVSDFQDIYDHYRQPSSDWENDLKQDPDSYKHAEKLNQTFQDTVQLSSKAYETDSKHTILSDQQHDILNNNDENTLENNQVTFDTAYWNSSVKLAEKSEAPRLENNSLDSPNIQDGNNEKSIGRLHQKRGGWAWFNNKAKNAYTSYNELQSGNYATGQTEKSDDQYYQDSNTVSHVVSERRHSSKNHYTQMFKSGDQNHDSGISSSQEKSDNGNSSSQIKHKIGKTFGDLFKRRTSRSKSSKDIKEDGTSKHELKNNSSSSSLQRLHSNSILSEKSKSETTSNDTIYGTSSCTLTINLHNDRKLLQGSHPTSSFIQLSSIQNSSSDDDSHTPLNPKLENSQQGRTNSHPEVSQVKTLQPAVSVTSTKAEAPSTKTGADIEEIAFLANNDREHLNNVQRDNTPNPNPSIIAETSVDISSEQMIEDGVTHIRTTVDMSNMSNNVRKQADSSINSIPPVPIYPARRLTFRDVKKPDRPNGPIQFTDSAFGFPLPLLTVSTVIMFDHRLAVNMERAIYRLSHLKLSEPKRALRQQVLLSNFMYAYLHLVNHTLYLEQQRNVHTSKLMKNGDPITT